MSTLRVNTIQDVAGNGRPNQIGLAKAWVSIDGTGVVNITHSYGVSSIGDRGVGQYTVNFSTPMPDANYTAVVSMSRVSGDLTGQCGIDRSIARSTTAFGIATQTTSGASSDEAYVTAVIFD